MLIHAPSVMNYCTALNPFDAADWDVDNGDVDNGGVDNGGVDNWGD